MTDLISLPPNTSPITDSFRLITPDTYTKYGVVLDGEGNPLYPYYTDEKLIGYKTRLKNPKRFPWEGDKRSVTMFRPRMQTGGNRYLILTEGEQDAMAAHQLTGYTAWSVPFGATSAQKYIKRCLTELETYDNIYVAFDNDDPGQSAAGEVMNILDPTKAQRVHFPPGIKDFNQLLKDWESAPDVLGVKNAGDYAMRLIWGAKRVVLDGVVTPHQAQTDAIEWYFNRDQRVGLPTGYDSLDRLVGGWRGGDFYTLVGGTGSSKSTMSRHFIMKQNKAGVPTAYITLEDTVPTSLTRFMEIDQGVELINSPTPVLTREQFKEASEKLGEDLHIADGMVMQDLASSIKRSVSYYARVGVKLIVLDHLTAVSDQLQLSEFNQFVRELYRLAGEHMVCIVAISHMARSTKDEKDNAPSLSRIKNSSAIAQWSTCVLGLERARDSNVVRLCTLKNNRTWGVSGEIFFQLNPDTMEMESIPKPLEGYDEDEAVQYSKEDASQW